MSPISAERQSLVDKIVKLLALADSTTFDAEAQSFRAKATQLMVDHNIALSEMKKKEAFKIMGISSGRQQAAKYETILLDAIAKFSGVAILICGNKDYEFIGTPSDLEAFVYMRDIIYRQRDEAWRAYYPKQFGKHPGAKYLNRWKMGFAYGVYRKLHDLTKAMEVEVTSRALVVVDPAAEALAWYETQFKLGKAKAGRGSKYDGNGYQAGKDVSINKGLEDNSGPAPLQIGH